MSGIIWAVFGVVGAVVVVGGGLVVLSMMETPRPSCADGTIAISKAAEDSFNAKWNAFDAAIRSAGTASGTLSEEEITSRASRYLADNNLTAKNVQVHLCPGAGKGQAALTVAGPGRDIDVVIAAHVDLAARPSRIAVDSVQMGKVPEQLATPIVDRLLALVKLEVPSAIREVTTTSTQATIRGQR